MFSFRPHKQAETYDEHVSEALNDVENAQHLRFINDLYRTKEVCLAAVKFESTHTCALTDFGAVPMGNLDYVVGEMRKIKAGDTYYLEEMEKTLIERKKKELNPGYYGDIGSYQALLDYYKASDCDDMLRKIFEKRFGSGKN